MSAATAQASDEIWGLPLQPAEAAANMLIARVGFDLLRSPAFQTAASAYVQKKLDQFRLPPYIGPLKVGPSASTKAFPGMHVSEWSARGVCSKCALDAVGCCSRRFTVSSWRSH